MSCVYIFAATEMEARPLRNIASADELVLITGAMGPKNARSKAESALSNSSRKPDAVLVIGLCGGLTPSLPEGHIVAYTDCLTTEDSKLSLQCSRSIVETIGSKLKSAGITCDPVVGITSARIATTRDERLALAKSGAAVVDMESYSIVQAASNAGVSAGVVRVVADAIDRTLPDFNVALNAAGDLNGRKALRVALASPISTAKLLAANRRAMQRLAEALQIILKNGGFAKAAAV
jgi:nucleoside phosphorylase